MREGSEEKVELRGKVWSGRLDSFDGLLLYGRWVGLRKSTVVRKAKIDDTEISYVTHCVQLQSTAHV